MSADIISPTVGRMVWFYPADHDGIGRLNGQPLSGQVAAVHNDRLVNLCVLDAYGNPQSRTNVTLVQPIDTKPDGAAYATWMPYQVSSAGVGQAAKHQAVETAVVDALTTGTGIVQTAVDPAAFFAETDGTSASETGLVTDAAPSSSEPTGENTEAPAA